MRILVYVHSQRRTFTQLFAPPHLPMTRKKIQVPGIEPETFNVLG